MATPEASIPNYYDESPDPRLRRIVSLERDVRRRTWRELEENDIWPEEIVEKMKELGLFGATIGEEYGGLGLSASLYSRIVERVSAVWMSVSGIFNSHLIMAAAIERFGTEAQKRRSVSGSRTAVDQEPNRMMKAMTSANSAIASVSAKPSSTLPNSFGAAAGLRPAAET